MANLADATPFPGEMGKRERAKQRDQLLTRVCTEQVEVEGG